MNAHPEGSSMPHTVDVRCPGCRHEAIFEFAEIVRISLRTDVTFFEKSPIFEYRMFQDACGHFWHGAIYYPGFHAGSPPIQNLPDGYDPSNWDHSKNLYRSNSLEIGSVRCAHCQLSLKHNLDWPADAYYSIHYRGKQLWAFNRESAVELRDFIASKDRNEHLYKWQNLLLHIPSIFKQQGARVKIVKKLDQLLA